MKIVRIFPKTNFRKTLRSDTLWGHIMVAYKVLHGDTDFSNLLKGFLDNEPAFRLSSCFPFKRKLDSENKELFIEYFPKPMSKGVTNDMKSINEMIEMKKFKKVKFVSKQIFEDYINGKLSDDDVFSYYFLGGESQEYIDELYSAEIKTTYNLHNSIDRMSSKTKETDDGGSLYWEEEISFEKDTGIFFLVSGDDNYILPSLRYLADIGIGGNNSIGKGSFSFSICDYDLNIPQDSNSEVLLSLYNPPKEELIEVEKNIDKCWYELEERRGYVGRFLGIKSTQKNTVIAIKEGSNISKLKTQGRIIKTSDVQNFPVYSYYFSFGIPAKLKF